MSTAIDLIREARAKGIMLEVEGANLYASGPVDEAIIGRLRACKTDLLTCLIARRHGIALAELRELAGKDWPELEVNPDLLECFADMMRIRQMRERGEVPPTYTARTFCRGCNATVPIFEGVGPTVEGCPWCFNRAAGRPVPGGGTTELPRGVKP